ncbi:MAG TPA: glycosyltransferase [Cyclobacteriaceae bacterium]|nr:glycosyltransferase [Cyclobacteriaceae bacterium]
MLLEIVWVVFFASAAIQLIYLLFIFGRLAFFHHPSKFLGLEDEMKEGVSIVIASRNELRNLKNLLPILVTQDYPQYEIVIVNDRSTDGTKSLLRKMMNIYPQLRTVTIQFTPSHVTGKKYALTLGIKVAKYDIILLTDADCWPVSNKWIRLMTQPLRLGKKQIALGHGAYDRHPGLLNRLIQYETLFTAVNYFSFALWKSPIMGVGRNLAYRKSFFMGKKAFRGFWKVNGGDDDLFVNQHAHHKNTSLVINPQSITVSQSKLIWNDFFLQKTRHYHAGRFYKVGSKLKLGIYTFSHLVFWFACIFLLSLSAEREPIAIILGLVVLRALIQTAVFNAVKNKLEGVGKVYWTMFFDLPYLVYFWVVGTKGYLSKKIKWK